MSLPRLDLIQKMLTRRSGNEARVAIYPSDLYSWRILQLQASHRSRSQTGPLGGQFRPLAVGFCLITSGPLAEGPAG